LKSGVTTAVVLTLYVVWDVTLCSNREDEGSRFRRNVEKH